MPKPKAPSYPVLPPVSRKTVETGLISDGIVSENDRPPSSVSEVMNMHFDAIGAATMRPGTTLLGNNLGSAILGLYYFQNSVTPSQTQLITVSGTMASYLSSGTWTSIRTGLTSGSKARFCEFLNQVFMVNGTEATALWDGNTGGGFVTTGNASGAPNGQFIETFRNTLFIAGNSSNPDAVYYSTVPVVGDLNISWDTVNQTILVSPNDGESITALHRTKGNMLVFKQDHIYRLTSVASYDPDPYANVGTYSQESVVETKAGTYFHHSSGFYQYNIYGVIQEISRPIIDVITAIPFSNYSNVCGWLEPDGDHVDWSVGTITVKGVTFSNAVIRYTISTQTWTVYSYPTQLSFTSPYINSGVLIQVVGDGVGNILQHNVGTTDNGIAITYALTHPWDTLDGFLSTRKTLSDGLFNHYQGTGTKIMYQVDGDPEADWSKSIGSFGRYNTGFPNMNIKGRKFRFRIAGVSTGQPFIYNGYELLNASNEFLQYTP